MKDQHENLVPPFRETILIVDDDAHIREVIRYALSNAGYKTCEAGNGKECLRMFEEKTPDLIVLDILMPEMDGTDVCKKIREKSKTPIIFLSSRDDEIDRIVGLELGGDDYVTKPFSPRELAARVKAVLRRGQQSISRSKTDEDKPLRCGNLVLDQQRFLVFWVDHEVILTATEFALVKTLLSNPGRVYTREDLMDRAYDHGTLVTDRTIDSHIRKIRSKFNNLGGDPIQTVRGVGYKLGPCQ